MSEPATSDLPTDPSAYGRSAAHAAEGIDSPSGSARRLKPGQHAASVAAAAAATGLQLGLLAVAWLCAATYLLYVFDVHLAITAAVRRVAPNIPYHPIGGLSSAAHPLFYGRTLALVLTAFAPGLVAALAIALIELLPRRNSRPRPRHHRGIRATVRHVLGWQLPGRRFWFYWCGGLSVGEFLFAAAFLAAFVTHMQSHLQHHFAQLAASERSHRLPDRDRNLFLLTSWGLDFGLSLAPCFSLLMWPVAHDSFLNHMLGLPWQNMIKYHRWMGNFTVCIITIHGSCYATLWWLRGTFWIDILSFQDNHPHLAGVLAWSGAFALLCTSVQYVRRRHFELFYRVHIAGFVVLVAFASMHYIRVWTWVLPGLMPWCVDLAFRCAQGSSTTAVMAASTSEDRRVASIELTLDKAVKAQPRQDYLLNVPSISRWEWHPFTGVAKPGSSTVAFNVKSYGTFTKELIAALKRDGSLPVRVQGPIGLRQSEHPMLRHPVLVCVVGGIGVSPVLAILNSLVADRAAATRNDKQEAAKQQRVMVIWASRRNSEFTILDESILAAATDKDGWLSMELYCTGHAVTAAATMAAQGQSQQLQPAGADSSEDCPPDSKAAQPPERRQASRCCALRSFGALPPAFSMARPVQPKVGSAWHTVAAILLAHAGVFCCLCLASIYYGEGNAAGLWPSRGRHPGHYRLWVYGGLLAVAAFAGALSLPLAASYIWAARRHAKSVYSSPAAAAGGGKAAAAAASGGDESETAAMVPKSLGSDDWSDRQHPGRSLATLSGNRIGFPESALQLDIRYHRPDISVALQEAVHQSVTSAGGADVGVIVAGPPGMVAATKRMVADLNDRRPRGAPALAFHQETWEL